MNAANAIDLDAYLARIALEAPVATDLSSLRALIAAHLAAIPFENLDPFLGVPVALDPAAVQRKLVDAHRGGYCYEQNRLFGDALRALGFAVTDLAARVLWGRSDDAVTAPTHMLLAIELAGSTWIADVGFGGPTPTGPLQLLPDVAQATPHGAYRVLKRDDGDWQLQAGADGAWRTLYRFDLHPQFPIDYRASNYWMSTHPDSPFVGTLVAARAVPGRRLALRNREFTLRAADGATSRRILEDPGTIRSVLETEFLIQLPACADLDARLAGLPRESRG
ncbi:MAG: arylamine N-acetyltransferase family protein [Rhodanobacteraceae bacterium]